MSREQGISSRHGLRGRHRPMRVALWSLGLAVLAVAPPATLAGWARPSAPAAWPAPKEREAASPGQRALLEAVRAPVEFLASDALEGRLTGSAGAARAAQYLVQQLRALGARPLPGTDGYRLPFEFTAGVRDAGSTLSTSSGQWGDGRVRALSLSDDGEVAGSLVFAGYGLVVPDSQGYPYDSYAGLDTRDKIVVVLRYFPEDVDQQARGLLSRYSGLRYKAMQAREHGARGILILAGPRSPNAGDLVPMTFDTAVAGSGIVAASIRGEIGTALFTAAGKDLASVQAELDTGNPHVPGFDLGTEARLAVRIERERRTGTNVVGMLPATVAPAPGSKPWVMLGAHYDHLGHGAHGNSLADKSEAGQVHNGADDNASGVAAVLAAGAQLAAMDRPRNVVLAFWSGEEMGLLGSTAFVQDGPIPPADVAAYLNFDMVGRCRDNRLVLQAVGTSPAWPGLIERSNVPVGFDVVTQDDPYVPTDSSAFNQARVPTLSFFTGNHEDYHRPSDDADKIDYQDLVRVARLGALIADRVERLESPPEFVAVQQRPDRAGDRDSVRAFTGTIPDYASDVEGLLLGGVIEGGPADEAGLQAGDLIVEFAGHKIANIYDYTYALDAVKVDEPVKVVVMRDGKRLELTLTPRARR